MGGSLTATRGLPVDSSMTVTVAPGTTAPCASTTVPEMAPVTVWPDAWLVGTAITIASVTST